MIINIYIFVEKLFLLFAADQRIGEKGGGRKAPIRRATRSFIKTLGCQRSASLSPASAFSKVSDPQPSDPFPIISPLPLQSLIQSGSGRTNSELRSSLRLVQSLPPDSLNDEQRRAAEEGGPGSARPQPRRRVL